MKCYGVIYKILNKVNGKVYIGQTIRTFKDRYRCKGIGIERVYGYHKKRKEKKYDYNEHLLNSIEKYGFESFEVIEEFDIANDKEELDKKEIYWIAYFDSFHNGYNQTEGGGGTSGFIPPFERKVINLTENKIFDSVTKASEEYGVDIGSIVKCCVGHKLQNGKKCNVYYHGKLPDGTPLVWKYYDEYLNMSKEEIREAIIKAYNSFERKVINLTENKIFDSVTKASEEYGVSRQGIIHCCKGYRVRNGKKCNVCYWGKLSDGTPLVWKYYDEYLREQL